MLMQESKVLNFMYLNCLIRKDRATLFKCSLAKMYCEHSCPLGASTVILKKKTNIILNKRAIER